MENSIKIGLSFGLASGVITTLGLLVGLYASTASTIVVIGGILTIAVADAFSDALGIHVSQESEGNNTTKEIWTSTIVTFLAKFVFALTFVIPVLLFTLQTAVIVCIAWGLFLIAGFSFYVAKEQKEKAWKPVAEHLSIAIVVIIATNFVGQAISVLVQ